MAKYYGKIGFATTEETEPGIWEEIIIERSYYGDLIKNYNRFENGLGANDNINISNQISIIADPYLNHNLHSIRYISFMGTNWKVTSIDVQYPRLILSLGGEYNAETGSASNKT